MGTVSRSTRIILGIALATVVAFAVCTAFGAGDARAGSGAVVWKKTPNPTADGDGLWLCASVSGALYACGQSGWPPGGGVERSDVWVVKYRADGTQAWSRTWDGPDGLGDEPTDMVADTKGNLYIAARTARAAGGGWDSVVLKYSPGGVLRWATVYPAAAADSDEAHAIALDGVGQVYLGGVAWNGADWDVYVAKFDPLAGGRAWTGWFDSGGYDYMWDLAVNGPGDSYVAGVTGASPANDCLLVKFTAEGAVRWSERWNGAADKDDAWSKVVLARSNGVFVAGEEDVLGPSNIVVARYEADETRKWVKTWSSSGSAEDQVSAAAVDRDGNVWVAGYSDRGSAGYRAILGKWTRTDGDRKFVKVMGTKAQPARFFSLVMDGSGNAYAAGAAEGATTGWNALAAKYSRGGALGWRTTATFGGNHRDELDAVCLGPTGYLYGCGSARLDMDDFRAVAVKIRR